MSVYLSYGRDTQGSLQPILDQRSGRTSLVCPFCSCPLIAVKGRVKAHHFRHDGSNPCHESLNEIPQIDGWHHFHLSLPSEVVEALCEGYKPDSQYPHIYQGKWSRIRLEQYELLKYNSFAMYHEFAPKGKIVLGLLPLSPFSKWMRGNLRDRLVALKQDVQDKLKHQAWLDIEAHRQETLLISSLYLFQFTKRDGSSIFKVGRTSRDLKIRLTETRTDVENHLGQPVTPSIIREVPNAGFVEKYVFHRYASSKYELGDHTEYLCLDSKMERQIKSDFTKLKNQLDANPLTKEEKMVASGRWRYEERRLAASRIGIERTLKSGSKFGRPKGEMGNEAFLNKHHDIVALLEKHSLSEIAAITGKSRSTVKRVKKEYHHPRRS